MAAHVGGGPLVVLLLPAPRAESNAHAGSYAKLPLHTCKQAHGLQQNDQAGAVVHGARRSHVRVLVRSEHQRFAGPLCARKVSDGVAARRGKRPALDAQREGLAGSATQPDPVLPVRLYRRQWVREDIARLLVPSLVGGADGLDVAPGRRLNRDGSHAAFSRECAQPVGQRNLIGERLVAVFDDGDAPRKAVRAGLDLVRHSESHVDERRAEVHRRAVDHRNEPDGACRPQRCGPRRLSSPTP